MTFVAIAPVLVPTNYPGERPTDPPPLDDFSAIVPNNANMPQSPTDSLVSSSPRSFQSRSSPVTAEYLSENESMDQGKTTPLLYFYQTD